MSTDYSKIFGQKDIILTNTDRDTLAASAESVNYMTEYFNKKQRFVPPVNFSNPKYFARFGSAEKYYIDAIDRIYKTYPYDGSLKERVQWELSSSYLDLHVFENGYPRTNGYVLFSAEGWGTQVATSDGYGAPATSSYEYILSKGGPNTSYRSQGKNIRDQTGDYKDGYANVWDVDKNRESNLKIGGIDGNTVEFWLKKGEFLGSSLTNQEVLFDLHTSEFISSSLNYGRLTVELTASTSGSPFRVTYMSGTAGFSYETIGSGIDTSSVADDSWHHYAFTLKNTESAVEVNFFVDGACNHTIITGSSISYVSGNINATLGALATAPSGTFTPTLGWGGLSGSMDEFRFWKSERTSQQIGLQYIEPVGGGTNTDDANTTLGVYYKFNEGITLTASIDKTILDYSGRISNGNFVGYNSSARNINSAMVQSGKVDREFKDPILYNFHPEVVSYYGTKKEEGRQYDYSNNSSIYFTLPAWILEEDEIKEYSPLRNFTQVIGSYFDSLASQIEAISKLKHKNYLSSSYKSYPFSDRLLESVGFTYFPELFSDATALEQFRNRDDKKLFQQKLYDTKNRIYQNIYNNIVYIYKTKGTEKSFRNLIRCFGFDDEIYKINLYGNRVTYQLKDNYSSVAESKNYVNFALTGTQKATVHSFSSSGNPNSTSFISNVTPKMNYFGFTMETEVAFPRRYSVADSNITVQSNKGTSKTFRAYVPFKTASLFGMHQVNGTTENDLTWATTDSANFQVYAIRDEDHSKRCRFKLTGVGATVIPTLTSSYFDEVFDDTRWIFSVSVKPKMYPQADLPYLTSVAVSTGPERGYTVEFYGVEKILDTIKNEFLLTGSITYSDGLALLNNAKSIYIGAHRTNFSGSLQEKSDGHISSTRVWLMPLTTGTIQQHAQDAKNYGVPSPYRSGYLYQTSMTGTRVPEIHTLVLNWVFDTLTGSDSSGEFVGQDFSSGSTSLQNRYNWIGNIVGKQYLPKGINFPPSFSKTLNKKYVYSAKKQLPEFINSSNMVNVMTDDDIFFNKVDLLRPTNYYLHIEKSMYQTISEEMIRMFSSIKDFNNLIGEPVNKYRSKYKHMEKLRQLFFERVGNTPDLDKYIDFYKWVDITLDVLLGYLVPASADIGDQYGSNIRTLVENHVLARNKYKWQFPTIEDKTPDIEGHILSINELLYGWEFGHNPTSSLQADNCLWWKERAERTDALASGDSNVNNDKQAILNSINNETNAKNYMLYDSATSTTYSGSTFAIRRLAKPYKFKVDESRTTKGGTNYYPNKKVDIIRTETNLETSTNFLAAPAANVESFKDCNDGLDLITKRKYSFNALLRSELTTATEKNYFNAKGALFAPFSMYSASISGGYYDTVSNNFKTSLDITNLHEDTYGTLYGVPVQGPFTDKYVGGLQSRHVALTVNPALTSSANRPEGWSLSFSSNILTMSGPAVGVEGSRPKATRLRDETAKRPINVRNIQQTTGSTIIGNYTKDYDLLMIGGRSINNRFFVKNEGVSASSINSQAVSGVLDYDLPGAAQSQRDRQEVVINGLTSSARNDYIIVNRFSAPGDPSTMGFAYLDIEAQEYSIYNSLPWRNLIVRDSLQELYTDHAKQFGYFSDAQNSASYVLAGMPYPGTSGSVNALDYAGSASFHKVNRNPRRIIKSTGVEYASSYASGVIYDNWHVQHQIPQSDLQYAWITASVIEGYTGSAYYGFEQPNFSNASLASTDITFCSASDFGSYWKSAWGLRLFGGTYAEFGSDQFVPTDFAGINSNVYEPITSSLNILGYPSGVGSYANCCVTPGTFLGSSYYPQLLNALILHRQGPYGWPSWKQIRGESHPVIRNHRKTNRQSFLKLEKISNDTDGQPRDKKVLISQIEPPVSSKYKPLIHSLFFKQNIDPNKNNWWKNSEEIIIDHTYANEKCYFPQVVSGTKALIDGNIDLNKIDSISTLAGSISQDDKTLIYDSLNKFIFGDTMQPANPISQFNYLKIKEVIYPREHYTYLSGTRERTNFANNFWRDTRNARDTEGSPDGGPWANSQGYIVTQSMWPLDCRSDTSVPPIPNYSNFTASAGMEGELQNGYSLFFSSSNTGPFAAATYLRRVPDSASEGILYAGDTLWEANTQAGVNPFYNNYAEYIEEAKRIGKDYGILPEFRISEHMDYYINSNPDGNPNFLVTPQPPGLFTLTGSVLSSSADEGFYTVYSYSDFMKFFELVKNDYISTPIPQKEADEDAAISTMVSYPSELTLECKVLKKFLPYDGFYPAERTVQLAKLFSQSYGDSVIHAEGANPNWRTMLAPLFAPGLLYNSIKSGIAVDYPIVNDTLSDATITFTGSSVNNSADSGDARLSGTFGARLPFEALASPKTFLEGTHLVDAEPNPQAFIDSSGSFIAAANPLFMYAMNNFLAEIPSFFLENNSLSTLTSYGDVSAAPTMGEDVTYKMRIVLSNGQFDTLHTLQNVEKGFPPALERSDNTASFIYNTPEVTMYNRSFDRNSPARYSASFVGDNNATLAYGSSFGPPCEASSSVNGHEASFEPFTPPYYNGYSHIEVSFLSAVGGAMEMSDILAACRENATYFRETTRSGSRESSTAGINAMQANASLNWDQLVVDEDGSERWVIQPKWECPILDFTTSDITLPEGGGSGSVAKGMWHQYGSIPSADNGIYLSVQDVMDPEGGWQPSLKKLLGYSDDNSRVKLGGLAKSKTISEAVVAIPFRADPQSPKKRKYFNINPTVIDSALNPNPGADIPDPAPVAPSQGVLDMVEKMKKYVIPPTFDFITNAEEIPPMAMLIFEFETNLSQKDLRNIWQNLPPNDQGDAKISKSQAVIPAMKDMIFPLFATSPGSMFDHYDKILGFPTDVQWLVFKVKQKAKTNYFDITAKDESLKGETIDAPWQTQISSEIPNYSFNWPYDFFSMIELAKLEITYKIDPHGDPTPSDGGAPPTDPEFGDAVDNQRDNAPGKEKTPEKDGPTVRETAVVIARTD